MAHIELLPHQSGPQWAALPPELRGGVSTGMRLMGAPALWLAGTDGSGVVVGVIDTGIDGDHPDLAGQVVARRDYVNDGRPPARFHPHGTHVAGTIAASGELKGVAPGARLRDYRVLNAQGAGTYAAIVQAIRAAADDGCHVINMSLGGPEDDPLVHNAVRYAVARGALVVVAVGNEGPGQVSYPGYYPEVVGVGAVYQETDGSIRRAWFSNTNNEVDVCAPGVEVVSCAPGGGYMTMSGTSMASPHGAGFAALLLHRGRLRLGRPLTEPAAWQQLKSTTVDVEDLGIDAGTGAGFLSIYPGLPRIRRVQVTIGKAERVVDGQTEPLDVAPRLDQNRTFSPIRHTHEPMGDAVLWDAGAQQVTLERLLIPGTAD